MMRAYLVFGSADSESLHWHLLGTYEANSADQARRFALLEDTQYETYAAVPERNWQAASPTIVKREPVIRWQDVSPGQMSVEDVLKEAEQEGLIEEVPEKEPTRPADTVGL